MKSHQINLNHYEVAQSLLEQNVIEKNVDMALISEQYRNKNSGEWVTNNSKKSAIWSCGNPRRQISKKKYGNCFARAHVNGIAFTCLQYLRSRDCRRRTGKSPRRNAWATEWGSPQTNARGKALLESFAALDLVLLNSGTKPTFSRAGTSFINDLTLVNAGLASGSSWEVSDTYTGSDHAAIICTINSRSGPPRVPCQGTK